MIISNYERIMLCYGQNAATQALFVDLDISPLVLKFEINCSAWKNYVGLHQKYPSSFTKSIPVRGPPKASQLGVHQKHPS